MRSPAALAALCMLAACEGNPVATIENASNLDEASASLLIAVRGRGEIAHTADLAGAASCSTVAPNPDKADCLRTYALGTVVSVQARPAPGFKLDHYSGACTGTGACSITMKEKRVLEAIFKATAVTPTSYTLKILVRGRGEVRHTADLAGATACVAQQSTADRAECARTYAPGAEITLEAVAAGGWRFPGWSGACAAAGTGKCTLKANENRILEVKFEG